MSSNESRNESRDTSPKLTGMSSGDVYRDSFFHVDIMEKYGILNI